MGLYDREYYREDEPRGLFVSPSRSVVTNLILINVALYLTDFLLMEGRLQQWLRLDSDLFTHPWQAWQLFTYGFVHDNRNIWHILGNMLVLYIFGYDVEEIYGRKAFLKVYLSLMVCAGLFWIASQQLLPLISHQQPLQKPALIGASGAIMGIMVIYVFHYPRRSFLLMGILPMPAWALGLIYVFYDLLGASRQEGNVAHVAHLAGAAFGYLYYRTGWCLASLWPTTSRLRKLRGPRLQIYKEQHKSATEETMQQQVDRILEKISREGEASLSKSERKTLEEASRRYQRRRG